MSKPRQKASKTKLRTMNEISAAEAQRLCHVAMDRGDYALAFPKDIAARDFIEFFKLYSEMLRSLEEFEAGSARAKGDVSEDSKTQAEIASAISYGDLDKKLFAGSREREVFDLLRQNPGISNQGIGEKLHICVSTVKTHLLRAFHKLELEGGRKEVWAKYPPRKT